MNTCRSFYHISVVTATFIAAINFVPEGFAAIKYVDGLSSGTTRDGSSWSNAWKNVTDMTGLKAGDVVYISGGPQGSSQTYSFSGAFNDLPGYAQGTTGSPVTYQIGQDNSHNGKAIFKQTAVGFSNNNFVYGASNVVFSGDAGDGALHFAMDPSGTSGSLLSLMSPNVNVRFSYWDLGTFPTIGTINTANKVELDHIKIKIGRNPNADRALYAQFTGSTWDDNKIHDCTILLPYNPSNLNFGPDGIQGGGVGYSIYNNTISSYTDTSLTTGQHMDGIQVLGGTYVKAYSNTITNMTNYGMYWEAYFAVFNHLHVYDNVISVTDPVLGTNTSGGIVVEQKFAGTMNDIVVVNNTIADLQPPASRTLTMLAHLSTYGSPYTNCVLANNALVNGNPPETDSGTPTPTNNVNVSSANAATYFKSYVKYGGASNDFRLTSAATTLINKGINVTALIGTVDMLGLTFGVTPSVGAYEYGSTSTAQAPTNATINISVQ